MSGWINYPTVNLVKGNAYHIPLLHSDRRGTMEIPKEIRCTKCGIKKPLTKEFLRKPKVIAMGINVGAEIVRAHTALN